MKQADWDILSDMTVTGHARPTDLELKKQVKKTTLGRLNIRDRVRAIRIVTNCAFILSIFYTIIYALMKLYNWLCLTLSSVVSTGHLSFWGWFKLLMPRWRKHDYKRLCQVKTQKRCG